MSNLDLVSFVVGALLPALVALVNRSHWPAAAKGVVVIASSLLAGAVTAWATGDLNGKTFAQSAAVIAAAAVAAYHAWWKPTGIAPAIEQATTPK